MISYILRLMCEKFQNTMSRVYGQISVLNQISDIQYINCMKNVIMKYEAGRFDTK